MVIFSTSAIICGLFLFVSDSTAATADHLVISQVQTTGGPGRTAEDFVEIYNPTGQDIDLKGMRLVKRTKTGAIDTLLKSWTSSTIIRARAYYLWANSSYTSIAAAPDVTTSGTIADDNGVALRNGPNDTGAIIDAVAWGASANAFIEGQVFTTNPGAGQSLERKPGSGQGNGEDTNNNANDFFLQSAPRPRNQASPTEPILSTELPVFDPPPAAAPTPAGPPAFLLELSEFMPNPKGRDAGAEWIEIYNPGDKEFSLADWSLDDDGTPGLLSASSWKLPADTVAPALGYLVLTVPANTFSLNNSGSDAVRLFDELGRIRLQQAYQGPAKEGYSYMKNSSGQWVWSSFSTPGSVNLTVTPVVYAQSIRINEALPNPEGDDAEGEFVELYNFGKESINLAEWILADSSKRYRISEDDFFDTEIPAGGYFVIFREVSGISLNNSGQEDVRLYTPAGDRIAYLEFDAKGHEAESYSRKSDGTYGWTNDITPGKENIFAEPGQASKPPAGQQPKSQAKTTTSIPRQVLLDDVRSQALQSIITTSGTVSVPPGVLGDNVIYLSGSGIRLSFASPPGIPIRLGDVLQITGKLASNHNELQLSVTDEAAVEVIEQGSPPEPKTIGTGGIGEETEGFLVRVSGLVTKSSGDTFYLDDGSGEARIYIRESTGIVKPKTKKGDFVRVSGVVSQYDEAYRLMPRFQNDLVFGQVLGEERSGELPRTGSNFWLILAFFSGIGIIIGTKALIRKGLKNE